MLILIRQDPDSRLREVITSIEEESPGSLLVYLKGTGLSGPTSPPLVLPDRTFSISASIPGVSQIDSKALLDLVHDNERILVLP
ncbi:MAG: hypothetical protein M0041_08250 [Nitrospiraceae bacterium]|jgi:hypothetical protein|nr:hypothetical protein [Nitrospiraceae bacterium]